MTFKEGESVKVMTTGDVVKVLYQKDFETLIVEIDGIDFPVFIKDVEKIDFKAHFQQDKLSYTKEKAAEKLKKMGLNNQLTGGPDRGLWLALQPYYHADGLINYFNVFLVNDSGQPISFKYELKYYDDVEFEFKKSLSGRENILLNSLYFDDINDHPHLHFAFENLTKEENYIKKFDKKFSPKAKRFLKPPSNSPLFELPVFKIELFKRLPQDKERILKKSASSESPKQKIAFDQSAKVEEKPQFPSDPTIKIKAYEYELDLHIDKITKSYRGMTNGEKLGLQMKIFEEHLNKALNSNYSSMVVIHGVGKGKLRKEIFNLLRAYPQVKSIRNDYTNRHGIGASVIIFE